MNDKPKCQTCDLWDKVSPADEDRLTIPMDVRGKAGQCRLFPPFYVTLDNDRCAQHSYLRAMPKPQPAVAATTPVKKKT